MGTTHLANLSVTTANLALNAITKDQIAADAVETAEINDGAVTKAKLATGAVDATVFSNFSLPLNKLDKTASTTCINGAVLKLRATDKVVGHEAHSPRLHPRSFNPDAGWRGASWPRMTRGRPVRGGYRFALSGDLDRWHRAR